jgi:protein-tyrosine phosphatase
MPPRVSTIGGSILTEPGENIPLTTLPNLRDLGGWPTRGGGRVRSGLLYRSTELHKLSDEDVAALEARGVRTVFDLRTEAERAAKPDRLPGGADEVIVDVLADASGSEPARLQEAIVDPAAAQAMLGGGKAERLFAHAYRQIVSLPSALAAHRVFFVEMDRPERRPALFHCTTGKDRTGWAAAAMLMLLGVSEEDVMHDYLLTNDQLLPRLQPLFDRFAAAGGDATLLQPVLGVRREYLDASLTRCAAATGRSSATLRTV